MPFSWGIAGVDRRVEDLEDEPLEKQWEKLNRWKAPV